MGATDRGGDIAVNLARRLQQIPAEIGSIRDPAASAATRDRIMSAALAAELRALQKKTDPDALAIVRQHTRERAQHIRGTIKERLLERVLDRSPE